MDFVSDEFKNFYENAQKIFEEFKDLESSEFRLFVHNNIMLKELNDALVKHINENVSQRCECSTAVQVPENSIAKELETTNSSFMPFKAPKNKELANLGIKPKRPSPKQVFFFTMSQAMLEEDPARRNRLINAAIDCLEVKDE